MALSSPVAAQNGMPAFTRPVYADVALARAPFNEACPFRVCAVAEALERVSVRTLSPRGVVTLAGGERPRVTPARSGVAALRTTHRLNFQQSLVCAQRGAGFPPPPAAAQYCGVPVRVIEAASPARAAGPGGAMQTSLTDEPIEGLLWVLPPYLSAEGRTALHISSSSHAAAFSPLLREGLHVETGVVALEARIAPLRRDDGSQLVHYDEKLTPQGFAFIAVYAAQDLADSFRGNADETDAIFSLAGLPTSDDEALHFHHAQAQRLAFARRKSGASHAHAALIALARINDTVVEAGARRAHEEIARAVDHVRNIKRSPSWKISAPVRWLKRVLRGKKTDIEFKAAYTDFSLYSPLAARLSMALMGHGSTIPHDEREEGSPLTREELLNRIASARAQGREVYVIVSTVDWHVDLYQRPQHLTLALAELGALSVFVRPPHHRARDAHEMVNERCVLTVDHSLLNDITGCAVLIYNTSHLQDPAAIVQIRARNLVVYEYIDHIDEKISGRRVAALQELQSHIFKGGADLIVASARILELHALASGFPNDRVVFVPNGVDPHHYEAARKVPLGVPAPLQPLKASGRPLIGYFGAIAPWLWLELLGELAEKRRDLSFVLIGPDYRRASEQLHERPNLRWIGPVDYQILPFYAAHFDAAMIPFRPGELAKATSPLKLFEYFAAGKAVAVTSDMLECLQYEPVFHGSDLDGFSHAIDAALAFGGQREATMRTLLLARSHSWRARAEALHASVQRIRQA